MQNQPPFAVPAVVIGIFGILLAGLYVLELAQPVSPTSPSTDSQPAAAAAGANAAPPAQNGVPKEVAPRKLEVRPEIFEKCYRAFVEWIKQPLFCKCRDEQAGHLAFMFR
ncbi:MAG: hypothetical protein NTY17_16930 [Planctomycetia bacterium]|nr:hypothetical protein [Planctomycetia bacterium]